MDRTVRWGVIPLFALALVACGDSANSPQVDNPAAMMSTNGADPTEAATTGATDGSATPAGTTPMDVSALPNLEPSDTGVGSNGNSPGSQSPTAESGGSAGDGGNEVTTTEPPAERTPALKCGEPAPNPSAGNACPGTEPPALKLTEVAAGLKLPTFVTHAPGDSTRLFVLEQAGTIRVIKDGKLLESPFLDLSSKTRLEARAGGERGLLGLAFALDYATSRRFWVNYTSRSGDTVIEGYLANADGDTADAASATELFTMAQPFANHNGGMLAFGPDGCLYAAAGDGGLANDPQGNGQNASTPLGGILRFDVDNPSTKPPGNVLEHQHLWSQGLRNPWRFSFDRETGDMYIGDVGQNTLEEIDVEPRGVAGRNYGWACREGDQAGPASCPGDFVEPVVAYPTNRQDQSVIGGYVYRGKAIPGMVGRYIYADYNSRKFMTFVWKGSDEICDEYEVTEQLQAQASISSFGEDAEGELYVVELGSTDGRVLRIDPQ